VFGDQQRDGIAAERLTPTSGKYWLRWLFLALVEPDAQHRYALGGERRATLLPPLAVTPHVCTRPKDHVLAGELGTSAPHSHHITVSLGHSRPSLTVIEMCVMTCEDAATMPSQRSPAHA
jgi:hypothetical protein